MSTGKVSGGKQAGTQADEAGFEFFDHTGKGSHSRFPARGRLLARDLCTHLASFGSSGVAIDG